MKPKRAAAYVRVSSFDQNTEAQETALREYVQCRGWTLHKICRDEGISGTKASRPALDELLRDCRRKAFDVVVVWKFDRFARSLTTLVSGLELCRALGIDFVSVTEAVDTSLPMGELMFQIIGAISQFERSLIAERVRSGLVNARAKGKVLGRPPLRRLSRNETTALRRERVQGKLPFRTLATKFGVSVWCAHKCSEKSDETNLDRTNGGLKLEKQKILIVDDNPDLRLAMEIRLAANHYDTVQASDGYSAISVAQKEHPNLIILDLGLPGGDGFAVLKQLQDSDALSSIPVIVLTGRDPQSNQQKALQAGATAFFQKPADNNELLDAIRATLQATLPGTAPPS